MALNAVLLLLLLAAFAVGTGKKSVPTVDMQVQSESGASSQSVQSTIPRAS